MPVECPQVSVVTSKGTNELPRVTLTIVKGNTIEKELWVITTLIAADVGH
jgi:hypothetical protein